MRKPVTIAVGHIVSAPEVRERANGKVMLLFQIELIKRQLPDNKEFAQRVLCRTFTGQGPDVGLDAMVRKLVAGALVTVQGESDAVVVEDNGKQYAIIRITGYAVPVQGDRIVQDPHEELP